MKYNGTIVATMITMQIGAKAIAKSLNVRPVAHDDQIGHHEKCRGQPQEAPAEYHRSCSSRFAVHCWIPPSFLVGFILSDSSAHRYPRRLLPRLHTSRARSANHGYNAVERSGAKLD
jgi:hypothetical protein